ncbi:hypothetical protein HanIR_Chr14g0699101 [Helianthus annuus]|nr:hypothetical protein HanIR_Chr14g0699101 [Helianthus annuus]
MDPTHNTPSLSHYPLSLLLASVMPRRFTTFAATKLGRRRCLPRSKRVCRPHLATTPYPLIS